MLRLQEISLAMIEHLMGYSPVLKAAANEYGLEMRQRILIGALGSLALLAAVIFACGWAALLMWDSEHRDWMAAGTVLALVGVGVGCAYAALHGGRVRPHADELAQELARDRALISRLRRGAP